eukprot:410036-Hanusia_phi.AAC.1
MRVGVIPAFRSPERCLPSSTSSPLTIRRLSWDVPVARPVSQPPQLLQGRKKAESNAQGHRQPAAPG